MFKCADYKFERGGVKWRGRSRSDVRAWQLVAQASDRARRELVSMRTGSVLAKTRERVHAAFDMKSRIPLLILVVACIALVVVLLSVRKKAVDESARQESIIVAHSNELQVKSIALAEVTSEKQDLEKQLSQVNQDYSSLSNNFVSSTSRLAQTQVTLAETAAALALAESKINELEGQNEALDRQAADLNQTLTNLTAQIEETQKQLDMAVGDKALLQAELERLMAEKAELERQLNDLDVLREQISRLKSELAISRRLDWIRRGLLGADTAKGATRQMQAAKDSRTTATPEGKEAPKFDLNVEILDDGTVRVLPPGGDTNAVTAPSGSPQ